MRKLLILFSLVLITGTSHGQASGNAEKSLIARTTAGIIANCTTDSAKAFAIFRWMTKNISYDVAMLQNGYDYISVIPQLPTSGNQVVYDSMYMHHIATHVLKTKKGVCDGYARLYKAMCDEAGVSSYYTTGYARNLDFIGQPFNTRHAWNVVQYNGKSHLVDVTWASGFVENGKFTREYKPYYYDTPPLHFILDHYPSDTNDAFLPAMPGLRWFFDSPFIWPGYSQKGAKAYSPSKGRIIAAKDSTIVFSLKFTRDVKHISISEEPGLISVASLSATGKNKSLFDKEVPAPKTPNMDKATAESKKMTDAIFDYLNALPDSTAYYDSVRSAEAAANPPVKEHKCYISADHTIVLEYQNTTNKVKRINFFADDMSVISYTIVPYEANQIEE